jgi:hypothetical protein
VALVEVGSKPRIEVELAAPLDLAQFAAKKDDAKAKSAAKPKESRSSSSSTTPCRSPS